MQQVKVSLMPNKNNLKKSSTIQWSMDVKFTKNYNVVCPIGSRNAKIQTIYAQEIDKIALPLQIAFFIDRAVCINSESDLQLGWGVNMTCSCHLSTLTCIGSRVAPPAKSVKKIRDTMPATTTQRWSLHSTRLSQLEFVLQDSLT